VFVAALSLYLLTLAPTISWAHRGTDGGDLIAAAATLGSAHPPGYPTYVLIGHLFAQLPIGDVAYRLNLMSAFCMALAAGLTTLGIARVARTAHPSGALSAAFGGLTFAVAPAVWSQAVIAEVHALNALCVAAVMCLITPALLRREPASTRTLASAAGVWGLGLGNSLTIAALAPMMLVAWRRSPGKRQAAAAFALGLSVYAFIPIRAAMSPPIHWGDATNLSNLVSLVTAELYRPYVFGLPLGQYPTRLIAFAQMAVAQFGWPGVLIGAWGMLRALPGRSHWRSIVATVALYAIFAVGYNAADSDLYLISVWLFGVWVIANGALDLLERTGHRVGERMAIGLIAVLIALGPGVIVITQWASIDASRDRRAEAFAQALWVAAPPNAILVTASDAHTFTLWYYRLVEGRRPDVAVVDVRLAGYAWYVPMLVAQGNAPHLPPVDPEDTWLARLKAANPSRQVCRIDPLTQAVQC